DLGRGSLPRHREQRDDAVGREIRILELSAGFVDGAPERQRNQLQASREALVVRAGQGREKAVLPRGVPRHACKLVQVGFPILGAEVISPASRRSVRSRTQAWA